MRTLVIISTLTLASLPLASCGRAYIATAEAFGYEKREQLTDRVEAARDKQLEAREQFESALAEFRALSGPIDDDLEALYDRLDDELDDSRTKADAVSSRITRVEQVANALFKEWREELDDYHTESLRQASEQQLEHTRERYQQLLDAMKHAEARMQPVLDAFADQVLFLKHNLNARAIASLQDNVAELETDIAQLIADMNHAIDEANAFIEEMNQNTTPSA